MPPSTASPPVRRGRSKLRRAEYIARVLLVLSAVAIVAIMPVPFGRLPILVVPLILGTATLAAVVLVGLTAYRRRERWRCLTCLGLCLASFGAGSIMLASGMDSPKPNGSTILFMIAVGMLLGFVVFDISVPGRPPWVLMVELAAIVGGGLCLASMPLLFNLLSPSGLWAVLGRALMNCGVDLVIAGVVGYQLRVGMRQRSRSNWLILGGCLSLAAIDFVYMLLSQLNVANVDAIFLPSYLAVLAVILVGGTGDVQYPVTDASVQPAVPMILVGAVAVAVLAMSDPPGTGTLTTIAGTLTMTAVLARMVLALRQARLVVGAVELSRTDELTGLLNRRALLFHLDELAVRGEPFTLMLMDLDKFKEINDSLGHVSGDIALTEISRRLSDEIGAGNYLARLGGDEFAVLTRECNEQVLTRMVGSLRRSLCRPFHIDGSQVSVDASVGATISSGPGQSASELLREADVAMYRAKASRTGLAFYNDSYDEQARTALQLSQLLREDLRRGALEMRYQGQIDAIDGTLVGAHAMVGWRHPSGELWTESRLYPLARHAGLLPRLIEAVALQVRRESADWLGQGWISRVGFFCDARELFSEPVRQVLIAAVETTAAASDSLMIHITEESFLAGEVKVRSAIQELRDHHVQISIDDYGVGFSSLSLLKDLPIQEIRMDPSFINEVTSDPRRRAIIESSARLARSLGVRLLAPGVVDEGQLTVLAALGVDLVQGEAVAPPLPPSAFGRWARSRHRAVVAVRAPETV